MSEETGDPVSTTFSQFYTQFLHNNIMDDRTFRTNVSLILDHNIWRDYLFVYEIYKKILHVPGNIFEFGCRYGKNLSMFIAFRALFESTHFQRRILGFDTFEGLVGTDEMLDGDNPEARDGNYNVNFNGYSRILNEILQSFEDISISNMPESHKTEVIEGDIRQTLPSYLEARPETLVALAYFDLDIYHPTYESLKVVLDHMPKGSVIVFDQLNYNKFPGETVAAKQLLPPRKYEYQRMSFSQGQSFIVL